MRGKAKLNALLAGECFTSGRSRTVKKKLADGRIVTIDKKGRVRKRAVKGNPTVDSVSCPLRFIGVGLRRHPESVIEIGDGRSKRVIRVRLR